MHFTWESLDEYQHLTTAEVASLMGVQPATVRVWAHRGKLTTLGYLIDDFRVNRRERDEGDRYAIYDRDEVYAFARSRGIEPSVKGMSVGRAAEELGITEAEVRVLAAAGELRSLGRGWGGEDHYDVAEYAHQNNVELASARRERWAAEYLAGAEERRAAAMQNAELSEHERSPEHKAWLCECFTFN